MKKVIYLILIIVGFVSCKKYEDDSFYSTYTVKSRLTAGQGEKNEWNLVKYISFDGSEVYVPENTYYMYFLVDPNTIKFMNGSVDNTLNFEFGSSKKSLEFEDGTSYRIKKLTINKLDLVDLDGNKYYFELKPVLHVNSLEQNSQPLFKLFSSVDDVTIFGFDCVGVKITGTLVKGKVVSNVSATINYTDGDGKTYLTKSHTSTGVTGLSATLQAGKLANGGGTLIYTISGTPNTAGTASFAIDLGGKSCAINITVDQTIGKPGPNITDSEGNSYKTVTIGTQQWMAENLKVSKYRDGTSIPNITDNTKWNQNSTGAWAYYGNDAANNAKYGKLYNGYAVSKTTNGNKNVCPTGWHVPTDAEWTVLTAYLGGQIVAGGKMKEEGISNWKSPNIDATNTSLFTGLPGGSRSVSGDFLHIGINGNWWSFSEDNTYPWNGFLNLNYSVGSAYRGNYDKAYGLSVRCLRD
jgi:uncharacterized protein (TIGR02145 family)